MNKKQSKINYVYDEENKVKQAECVVKNSKKELSVKTRRKKPNLLWKNNMRHYNAK